MSAYVSVCMNELMSRSVLLQLFSSIVVFLCHSKPIISIVSPTSLISHLKRTNTKQLSSSFYIIYITSTTSYLRPLNSPQSASGHGPATTLMMNQRG